MSVCILGAAGVARIAATAFTLSWTHSVEKTRWEEDWRVTPAGLQIVEARVEGFGAGMEPGEGATRIGSMWRWTPKTPPMPRLLLRRSDAVPAGWTLCAANACRAIADAREAADVVTIEPCE